MGDPTTVCLNLTTEVVGTFTTVSRPDFVEDVVAWIQVWDNAQCYWEASTTPAPPEECEEGGSGYWGEPTMVLPCIGDGEVCQILMCAVGACRWVDEQPLWLDKAQGSTPITTIQACRVKVTALVMNFGFNQHDPGVSFPCG